MDIKTDKRIYKSKAILKQSMIRILGNQSISCVTISMLCKDAHINRNTFYRYYKVPGDVLDEILSEQMAVIIDDLNKTAPCQDYNSMLHVICDYIYHNKELSTLLLSNKLGTNYLRSIIDKSNQNILSIFFEQTNIKRNKDVRLVNRYATGGTLLILQDWCLNGFRESPSVITESLSSINTFLLDNYLFD